MLTVGLAADAAETVTFHNALESLAHAERERQRKAKTIVLDTARRAQTEQ